MNLSRVLNPYNYEGPGSEMNPSLRSAPVRPEMNPSSSGIKPLRSEMNPSSVAKGRVKTEMNPSSPTGTFPHKHSLYVRKD